MTPPAWGHPSEFQLGIEFAVTGRADLAPAMQTELRQILDDLGLVGRVRIE